MDSVKKMLGTTKQKTQQLFQAPPEVEGNARGSTQTQFSVMKRRITQNVLQSIGKAEETPDTSYDLKKTRLLSFERMLRETRKGVMLFLDGMKCTSTGTLMVGQQTTQIMEIIQSSSSASSSSSTSSIRAFSSALSNFENHSRSDMDTQVLSTVLLGIDSRLSNIETLKGKMHARELLKVDLDARTRKLNDLKKAGSSADAAKLLHKQEKLDKTKSSLHASTTDIFAEIDEMERDRYTGGLGSLLSSFGNHVRTYHTIALRQLEGMPMNLPSFHPPQQQQHQQEMMGSSEGVAGGGSTITTTTTASFGGSFPSYTTTSRGTSDVIPTASIISSGSGSGSGSGSSTKWVEPISNSTSTTTTTTSGMQSAMATPYYSQGVPHYSAASTAEGPHSVRNLAQNFQQMHTSSQPQLPPRNGK